MAYLWKDINRNKYFSKLSDFNKIITTKLIFHNFNIFYDLLIIMRCIKLTYFFGWDVNFQHNYSSDILSISQIKF